MTVRGADVALGRAEPVVERDDVQHVQVLALVLVQPLDLHVEQRSRIDTTPVPRCTRPAACLLSALTSRHSPGTGVVGQRLERLELARGRRASGRRCAW